MGLLERLRGGGGRGGERPPSLASDAASMRTTLTGIHSERGGRGDPDLRAMVRDLLEGEVEAPTGDVRWLISEDVAPDEFHDREIRPNWEGLDELARADKLDNFLDLIGMLAASPDALPREMAATVRTKTLILAWAFDEVHGYIGRLVGGRAG